MPLVRPHNLDSERAAIKCILGNKDILLDTKLKFNMMYGEDNSMVFKTLTDIKDDGRIPDEILIKDRLVNLGLYDMVGGDAYFEKLNGTVCLESNMDEYERSIIESFISRCVINSGNSIVEAGYNKSSSDAMEVVFNEADSIFSAASFGDEVTSIGNLLATEMLKFDARIRNPGGDGIKTGFQDYDLLTGGMMAGDELVVAARPSMGKTSLALKLMLNLGLRDVPTGMVSYEMSLQQLTQRLLSMHSGVGFTKIKNGMIEIDEYHRIVKAQKEIQDTPMYIDNDTTGSVSDIVSRTKRLVRDKGLKVLFVDYLQLIPHRIEYATQDIGQMARMLKSLALSSDITVVTLSQLNRDVERRGSKIPILADLRQSGNIEEHADLVMFIHREEMYTPTAENRGQANLYIRKHRNGPLGVLPVTFSAQTVNFNLI